jgi:hypothetical protein
MIPHPHMDLDDRVIHYLLMGAGLALGSFATALWNKLAEKFWDKEWVEFRKFKASKDKE